MSNIVLPSGVSFKTSSKAGNTVGPGGVSVKSGGGGVLVSRALSATFAIDKTINKNLLSSFSSSVNISQSKKTEFELLQRVSVTEPAQFEVVAPLIVSVPSVYETLKQTESGYQVTFETLTFLQAIGSTPFEYIGTDSLPTYEYLEMALTDSAGVELSFSDTFRLDAILTDRVYLH